MENSSRYPLIVGIITLAIVVLSYFGLLSAIERQDNVELLAAGPSITVSGTGTNVTFTSGGGNCSNTSTNIKAQASIVGGANGNSIKVVAKCSLSNWSASTTSTDTGGAAVYSSNTANAGQGRANCTPSYTSTAAPDSAWTAVCSF